MRVWLTVGGFALAFLAAGVFFATRDSLSDMDQFASVGSFLLALVTLGLSAVAVARRREPPTPPAPAPPIQTGNITDVQNMIIGHHSHMTITDGDPRRDDD